MRIIILTIGLLGGALFPLSAVQANNAQVLSRTAQAESGITLDEAIRRASLRGRVLRARTVGEWHQIRIMTPRGVVRTLRYRAASPTA